MSIEVHSRYGLHGAFYKKTRYVIIDDLIDSGSTVRRIVKDIKRELDGEEPEAHLVGIYLYEGAGSMQLDPGEHESLNLPKVPIFWPNRRKLVRLDP